MRKIIKSIVGRTWKPYVQWYLRAPRKFNYKNISIDIIPGVFHPGFFFSTKLLISYLEQLDLSEKKILEVGCGSGLVSIFAAKQNAIVTSTDIFPLAVSCARSNAQINNVNITFIESDLFQAIPKQTFDFIVVNPPYYKKKAISPDQFAWYCGENLEYFSNFFQQAKDFVNEFSRVIMVLSDECDIEGIHAIAKNNGWSWTQVVNKKTGWENGFIFDIRMS